jgi:DNA-binding transcriptional LysR family regulator
MAPTEFATHLVSYARNFIETTTALTAENSVFDPRTSTKKFMIYCVDYFLDPVISRLYEYARKHAPNVTIVAARHQFHSIRELLETGQASLVLTLLIGIPDTLITSAMEEVDLCCIVRQGHPKIDGAIDIEQYGAADHVTLCFDGAETPYVAELELDAALGRHGCARRKLLQISTVTALPSMVAKTDLIATVPLDLAISAAKSLPLQVLPLPFAWQPMKWSLVWHARANHDPASRWLRDAVRRVGMRDRYEPKAGADGAGA